VCLMDMPDDWNMEFQIERYKETFDRAIAFAEDYPDTLWCYGNHDVSYSWGRLETGYSPYAERTVMSKLEELENRLKSPVQINIMHRIDNVLFSHGGLTADFLRWLNKDLLDADIEEVIAAVNDAPHNYLWNDESPLWFRPQYETREIFRADIYKQVVGHTPVEHLVYASSSSVYGSNKKVPYSTDDKVDNPVSLYAATKKSNELMAHAYSKLYNIPSTGLRFFTVYGPAGRPDMAYFGFTNKLLKGETIQIFNYGNCKRDFTYVDDIVEGVVRVMQGAPERKNGEDGLPVPPYAVYNIGNQNPENLLDFVQILQEELIRAGVLPEDYDFEAHKELVPMQPGDVPVTYADNSALERDFGYKPSTSLRTGLRNFAEWYAEFYK